jgi:hypothetical protein
MRCDLGGVVLPTATVPRTLAGDCSLEREMTERGLLWEAVR